MAYKYKEYNQKYKYTANNPNKIQVIQTQKNLKNWTIKKREKK